MSPLTEPIGSQHLPPLVLSTGDIVFMSAMLLLIVVSVVGNTLVCVAIFTDRRLRKLGNAFIVSLAIADLFVSCLVMTFALCNDLLHYWLFGSWFCDVWISFDVMCCTASILNLCAISLDRFIHIKDCLLYNQWMTRRVAISTVIIIWFISGLVSFVPINMGWHKPPVALNQLNSSQGVNAQAPLEWSLASVNNNNNNNKLDYNGVASMVGSDEWPQTSAHSTNRRLADLLSAASGGASGGRNAQALRYDGSSAADAIAAAAATDQSNQVQLNPLDGSQIQRQQQQQQQQRRGEFVRDNKQQPELLPQCALQLTPTYAVVSSTISFYIPCIIMLGLYTKLFACARKHVRNIQAFSKVPAPLNPPVQQPIASASNGGGASSSTPTSGPQSCRCCAPKTWLRLAKRRRHRRRQRPTSATSSPSSSSSSPTPVTQSHKGTGDAGCGAKLLGGGGGACALPKDNEDLCVPEQQQQQQQPRNDTPIERVPFLSSSDTNAPAASSAANANVTNVIQEPPVRAPIQYVAPTQPPPSQGQQATHKAAITLGIIMGTFLCCWVPFFCLNIIRAFCLECIPDSMFRAFTWLGYANSALNPIIYGIHNSEFRHAFNRIFFKHLNFKNSRYYLSHHTSRHSYDLRHSSRNNNNNNNNSALRKHNNNNSLHKSDSLA